MRYTTAGVVLCLLTGFLAPQTGLAEAGKYDGVGSKYEQIRRDHWSFQPVRDVTPPAIKSSWPRSDVDRYVLAKLDEKELKPSSPADRRTLLRRATFDLTGLPPTQEEVESFVNDNSPKAFEKVIDRLLASPAFGERWGRHWLDVARYAESTGMTRNVPYYYAWRYRDYVIDSFNADKPYDQFIKEQLAGDLLPASTDKQRDEQTIATGFLALGTRDLVVRNPLQYSLNTVDEQIDTTTRAFMGMTVACARCHDHKFDPIPTAEYYSMAGIFRSTETLAGVTPRAGPRVFYNGDLHVPLSGAKQDSTSKKKSVETAARVTRINDDRMDDDRADAAERRRQQQRQELRQQATTVPEREARPVAVGVKEGRLPADSNVFIRGDFAEKGPIVARGTITLPGMQPLGKIPSNRSGRLELAGWVASKDNPLTSRVMVNRIWQHLFGRGLVDTVDNFGTTGDAPTHPELLDHLAIQFATTDQWSVKKTIRRLMLTSTYQQAGTFDEAKFAVDPDNRLFWRATPRRLEGEAIRDAILAASGQLNTKRPAGSDVMRLPALGAGNDRIAGRFMTNTEDGRRSVYLTQLRGVAPAVLDAFDLADNSQVTGCRDVTTVAPQALFMMNDVFVIEQSKTLAKRVLADREADVARIDRAYSLTLGRVPNDAERQRAMKYVKSFVTDEKAAKESKPERDRKSIREERRERKMKSVPPADNAEVEAWASLCQALFASAEFRYLN